MAEMYRGRFPPDHPLTQWNLTWATSISASAGSLSNFFTRFNRFQEIFFDQYTIIHN
jgi:hypothetical protein